MAPATDPPPGPLGGGARAARLLVLFLAILAPALLVGRPSVFADSPLYYGQGEALFRALAGAHGALDPVTAADPFATAPGSLGARTGALLVAGARSPTYGLILYLAHRAGGLAGIAALQAAFAAVGIELFLSAFAATGLAPFLGACAFVSLGSALPFFAGFAMPDVFSGVDLLMCAAVLAGAPRPGLRLAAGALLALGAATHPTHLLVIVSVALLGPLLLKGLFGRPVRASLAAVLVLGTAAGVGAAVDGAGHALLERAGSGPQSAPPFLMARLLEDGPGRAYLARTCPGGAAPILCGLRTRRLDDSESFLWSGRPDAGVLMTLPPAARLRLKASEGPFVAEVVRRFPLSVAMASAANAVRQVLLFATVEPLHSPAEFAAFPFWRKTSLFVRDTGGRMAPRGSGRGIPAVLINLEETLLSLAGVGLGVAAIVRSRGRADQSPGRDPRPRSDLAPAFALLALGVGVNALICGVLSGPFPRYEARLFWVLPLCGLLLALGASWSRRPEQAGREDHVLAGRGP